MTFSAGRDAAIQLRLPEVSPDATDYAVFDLETTGLHPASCQIIEIGWCVVRGKEPGPVRSLLVLCDGGVPHEIETLTGISSAVLEHEGIPLAEALGIFLAETRGLPLVGHNVLRFDMPFLEAACRKAGLNPPGRPRYRDTAALYKARCLGMTARPNQDHWSFAFQALDQRAPGVRYALHICCQELGISLDGVERHRAAGDVVITQQVYARLVSSAG